MNNSESAISQACPAPAGARVSNDVRWTVSEPVKEHVWAMLYRKYADVLFDYGMQMSHNRSMVSDCLKELFTGVKQNTENLSDDAAIRLYLFKSLRDLLIRQITENGHGSSLRVENAFEFASIADTLAIEDEVSAGQPIRSKNLFGSLVVSQREIMYLRCRVGLTHSEIGKVTGMQTGAIDKFVPKVMELLCNKMNVPDSSIPLL